VRVALLCAKSGDDVHIRGLIIAGLIAALPASAGAVSLVLPDASEADRNFAIAPSRSDGLPTIRQRFETVAGQSYVVEVAPRGGSAGVRTALTSATGGVTQTSTFDTAGQSSGALGWRTYAYSFVANGTPTTMVFADLDGGAQASALVPVTVAELPEPAIWAMMVFGFFGLSFAVRRRDIRPKSRVRFT
jgi:hypothetical protein